MKNYDEENQKNFEDKRFKKKVIEKNQIQIIVNLFIKTYIIQNNYNYYKI